MLLLLFPLVNGSELFLVSATSFPAHDRARRTTTFDFRLLIRAPVTTYTVPLLLLGIVVALYNDKSRVVKSKFMSTMKSVFHKQQLMDTEHEKIVNKMRNCQQLDIPCWSESKFLFGLIVDKITIACRHRLGGLHFGVSQVKLKSLKREGPDSASV